MTPTPGGIAAAAEVIRRRLPESPSLALILGSGLGGLADRIDPLLSLAFWEIPGIPQSSVAGHSGRLVAGKLEGKLVIALAGRLHMYEGHDAATVTLPVRVLHALGARTLFVSNAAGGIREDLEPGDLMVIEDHLNMTFRSPLEGPAKNGEARFPDMTAAYDPELRALLARVGKERGIVTRSGVYAWLSGPQYETPAEIRMLRTLGADAVGMSTVPEVIVARSLGMRVAGVSCITNAAAGKTGQPLTHDEVLQTTNRVAEQFQSLVSGFVKALT